jgi:hypothetical protein
MVEYEHMTTHAQWRAGCPPEPEPPYGDKTWRLVAATSWGDTVAFYWQTEAAMSDSSPK